MKLRTVLKLIVVSWILLGASLALAQTNQNTSLQPTARPLNMLVLGDSILWGEGLKAKHKSWYQVKIWLEKNTGRPVVEKIAAHSGAVIELGFTDDRMTANNAEVNVALPTVNDEVDNALKSYADGSKVDLVLMNGCINDVNAQNLLNASGKEEIDRLTLQRCGLPMEKLLRHITTSFPKAEVIVTGYYPFFSEQTPNDFIMKAFTKRFFKIQAGAPKDEQ